MSDGMRYAPQGAPRPVVGPGEFRFAATRLEHGHIHGMCRGLVEAGADLVGVHDPDPAKIAEFQSHFPQVPHVTEAALLEDASIRLIATAAVPSERAQLGLSVLATGKHYFTDKAPFTDLTQLDLARQAVKRTGLTWAVYYSERIHNEAGVRAGQLIRDGAIGRVLNVIGTGPHRLSLDTRPDWFFRKASTGGIICDIGSHQTEQFLYYTGNSSARAVSAQVANYHHPDHPELEDFGQVSLVGNNGATGFFRVDWFTPDGLRIWGDGRSFIMGTEGYLELRKYIDLTSPQPTPGHIYLVNHTGEYHEQAHGKVGFPYFGQLIRDCLDGTENSMRQSHTFAAAQLCLEAQAMAVRVAG